MEAFLLAYDSTNRMLGLLPNKTLNILTKQSHTLKQQLCLRAKLQLEQYTFSICCNWYNLHLINNSRAVPQKVRNPHIWYFLIQRCEFRLLGQIHTCTIIFPADTSIWSIRKLFACLRRAPNVPNWWEFAFLTNIRNHSSFSNFDLFLPGNLGFLRPKWDYGSKSFSPKSFG